MVILTNCIVFFVFETNKTSSIIAGKYSFLNFLKQHLKIKDRIDVMPTLVMKSFSAYFEKNSHFQNIENQI